MTLFLGIVLAASIPALTEEYLERYFRTFPTRATEAGRHDLDRRLEDLSPARRAEWLRFNRALAARLETAARGANSADDRLDAEVLLAQIRRERHELEALRRAERDPLYWTGLIANATVFLLARDDLPREEAIARARARAVQLPRLAAQAREALGRTPVSEIAPELCRIAASQARASATFYREGFGQAAAGLAPATTAQVEAAGERAARGLSELAVFLDRLAERATGSPRLGALYAQTLRVGTGIEESPNVLLARAEVALAAKRGEAAEYGRQVFADLLPGETMPSDDRALLRRLFARVAMDRDHGIGEYVKNWRVNVSALEQFLRVKQIVTLPDPLTLVVDVSPPFFVGQSVGGVYPAGPYALGGKTILFLPVPPESATPQEKDAFFRDFNRHFNAMIAPHELLPGHYLQLKLAARHPHKVRAVFPDPVYLEGWGTFCERLMLDQGWSPEPLTRLAHLKKQLENIARAIVDVRVHSRGASREEVLHFVKDEALQDEQFAANMWTRAITTSPQITTYFLGYEQVRGLYEDVARTRGLAFSLREFMDGMMALGPVAVRHYRARMLGTGDLGTAPAPGA